MRSPDRVASHYFTDSSPLTATIPLIFSFSRRLLPFLSASAFALAVVSCLHFRITDVSTHASPFRVYSLCSFYIRPLPSPPSGAPCSFFSAPATSVVLCSSSVPSSPERPDAHRPGSARHPYSSFGAPPAAFLVPITGSLPPARRVALFYLAMKSRRHLLSTGTPVTGGTPAPHTSAPSDSYLAMARPFDVRDSCNPAGWG